jgi:formylmethanofuran dehydrogenase subunit E
MLNAMDFDLDRYRETLLRAHDHICPRQVLGLRMGELAAELFRLPLPQQDKRMLAFVESDGCFADGVVAASGCSLGHRTMRLVDEGKIAVTFVDTVTERAIRIWPQPSVRQRAAALIPDKRSRWHAQLEAYQRMPADELLSAHDVGLSLDLRHLVSRNGIRATCAHCGEEIINEREVIVDGQVLCCSCSGARYYQYLAPVGMSVSPATVLSIA